MGKKKENAIHLAAHLLDPKYKGAFLDPNEHDNKIMEKARVLFNNKIMDQLTSYIDSKGVFNLFTN